MIDISSRWKSVAAREKWAARGAVFVTKVKATKAVWLPPKPGKTGTEAAATAARATKQATKKTTGTVKKTTGAAKRTGAAKKATGASRKTTGAAKKSTGAAKDLTTPLRRKKT